MTVAVADRGKNIVVCCDGTGNQIEGDLSNVMKLYRMVERDDDQRVFYETGVGTIGNDSAWGRLRQRAASVVGLVTGNGLDQNILDGYRFLCANHRDGDRIMLFGFSRGAYAVRALAGLIHMVGLLHPDQINLTDHALNAYKHSAEKDDLEVAWDFSRMVRGRRATVHFLGAWDTVASMIVPRPDRMYIPSLRTLPFTRFNPSVRAFRHAIAIDERRRMFRLNRWKEGQSFVIDPFSDPPNTIPQDCLQMWFAGVHADIGGGYPETRSGLAKFPLQWMVDEAIKHGLRVRPELYDELVMGKTRTGSRHFHVPPDPAAPLHRSLTCGWWPLEILPKLGRWKETRKSVAGLYLPMGEHRHIPPDGAIAPSAIERQILVPGYRPKGLGDRVRAD